MLTRQLSAINIKNLLRSGKNVDDQSIFVQKQLKFVAQFKNLPLVYVLKIVRVLKLQITSGDTLSQTERWHTGEKLRKSGQK